MKRKNFRVLAPATLVMCLAITAFLASGNQATRASYTVTNEAAVGSVYVHAITCCKTITLGGPSSPTLLFKTKVIPPGSYLVTADVGVVMGPAHNSGGQEGVVCAYATSQSGDHLFTLFGGTGNGATESGTGAGGVYGNAVMTGTLVIVSTNTNDHVTLTCNSTTGTQGTYASAANLTIEKVAAVIGV